MRLDRLGLAGLLCQPGLSAGGGVGVHQALGDGHVDPLLGGAVKLPDILALGGAGHCLDASLQLGLGGLVTGGANLVLAVALDL